MKSAGDLPGAETGILVGFAEAGQPLIDYPAIPPVVRSKHVLR